MLHLKKMYAGNIQDLHPAITDEDIYSCHPADLLKNGRRYLISFTRYTEHRNPKRVRVTRSGYRWKQQGRALPLKYNGQPVAMRTYLSFVALGRKNCVPGKGPDDPNYVNKTCRNGGIRRHAIYTMEEVTLLEDYIYEKNLTSKGIRPCPIPVLYHILCKYKEPLYNSREAVPSPSASASASHELPCLEARHDEEGGDELMLSATFNGLESLDGTVVDSDLKNLIAGLSYWESFLLL
ncbi:hypothetical protein KI387_005528 [Taxus chinensis]|uniref:NAC domain-containing protein n=1 Tax=Taxus chinensis TaxID=29808 RepID=A0AA38GR98_TAXCH|nr:hypothetical protein KI387_005528 [Taxus chinensis]